MNLDLVDDLKAANEFNENFLRREKSGEKAQTSEPFVLTNKEVIVQLDQFKTPLKVPPLQMAKDGYVYRTSVFGFALKGDVVIRDQDNEEITIHISAPGQKNEE